MASNGLFTSFEFSQEIDSITIIRNAKWTVNCVWSISFATMAIEAKPGSFVGTTDKVENSVTTVTIKCEVSGAKYFRIDHTISVQRI